MIFPGEPNTLSVLLHIVHVLLVFIALAMAVPVAVLAIEVAASLLPRRDLQRPALSAPCSLAVVVPAHDEGENLRSTLADISLQLRPHDRLIVIADNCTDNTAEIASSAGATVLVRTDPLKKGKGFALSFAIEQLSKEPPDYVVFIDADCRLDHTVLGRLRDACAASGRPVQACYLMRQPEGTPLDHRLAEFTWLIRNYVRPLGLRALGLPTQLMGSGMMFPWRTIATAPLASGDVVEDLKLGLDLACSRQAALLVANVTVTSTFAASNRGIDSQRRRWVHGHLSTIARRTPRLLAEALITRNIELLALTFDLLVPPLSVLITFLFAMLALSTIYAVAFGYDLAFRISLVIAFAFSGVMFLTWWLYGRHIVPLHSAPGIARAFWNRLGLLWDFAQGKVTSTWVRTERKKT